MFEEAKLISFLDGITQRYVIHREVKAAYDMRFASEFNVFSVMPPNENRISDVIAFLLNPDEIHGQRDKFFRLFLDELCELHKRDKRPALKPLAAQKLNAIECEAVHREYIISGNRRLDILIQCKDFNIGIENKPWAGYQERQLEDYYQYLDSLNTEFVFLCFTPSKQPPDAAVLGKLDWGEQVEPLTFQRFIIPWLDKCIQSCEADRVRMFITDFKDWMSTMFKEDSNE